MHRLVSMRETRLETCARLTAEYRDLVARAGDPLDRETLARAMIANREAYRATRAKMTPTERLDLFATRC